MVSGSRLPFPAGSRVILGLIQRMSPRGKSVSVQEVSLFIRFGGKMQGVPHLHARWVEAWIKGFIQVLVSVPTGSRVGTLCDLDPFLVNS